MSGETEQQESGWTIDTLRYHFQQQHDDLIVRLNERLSFQQEAVKVALADINKRLDGMNEFRGTLSDQSKTYITRSEFDLIRDQVTRSGGKEAGNRAMVATGIAALAVLLTLVSTIMLLATR